MKNYFYFTSKLGDLTLVSDGENLLEIDFGKSKLDGNLKKDKVIEKTIDELEEYFKGKRREFSIPLKLEGTEFQKSVWTELLNIPYGETRTYGEIAKSIGNEKGSRAVGNANNKNPIPIIVPCHRVIGSNNKLVGYGGGLDIKEKLLNLEREGRKI